METSIHDTVQQIFQKVFPTLDKSAFRVDRPRNDFENWDSLNHMQLVSELETACGVTFDMDEVVNINSPQDFITLIEKKRQR